MTFPKAIMSVSELMELGFKRAELLNYARLRDQDFAMRIGQSRNSPIKFDTERFGAFLDRQRKIQQRAMRRA